MDMKTFFYTTLNFLYQIPVKTLLVYVKFL